jgi:sialate O-acetylesterase
MLALIVGIAVYGVTTFAEEPSVKPVRGEDLIVTPAKAPGLIVHNLFQSGMVLQRSKPIRVWGWADAGDAVTVTIGEKSASTKAGNDGRWEVTLPAMEASRDGIVMTVKGKASELRFDNILIGDVWLLGGQSNMEFPIAKVENGQLEKVAAWDPAKELENTITRYEGKVAQLKKEGKDVPADMKRPTDAGPGPRADRNFPGNCYQGLLAPLRGLEVKGAIFHQGYNNCFSFSKGIRIYAKVFPEMIRSWRETFNDPLLPFGIISLCTEGPLQTDDNYLEMMANVGPELREVQYRTFLNLQKAGDKNIGYTSSFDLNRRWYHPQLKIPAGERIARWALTTQYGMRLEWEPARIEKVVPEDGALVLTFTTEVGAVEDGGGAMKGFGVAGEDRHFQPAEATYLVTGKDDRGNPTEDQKVVVLRSPLVAKPLHFRYAWGRNPMANVQLPGHSDVPLATQRSDQWDVLDVPVQAQGRSDGEKFKKVRAALQKDDLERRLYEARKLLESHGS